MAPVGRFSRDAGGPCRSRRIRSSGVDRIFRCRGRGLSEIFPDNILPPRGSRQRPRRSPGRHHFLALLLFAWRTRRALANSREFTNILAAFLMGTTLVFPLLTPFNQVLLILPAMLLLRDWKALPRFSRLIFVVSVSWPWIISSVLLLFPPRLDSPNQMPLLPSSLVLFFPLFLPLLLMTRRSEPTSQLETTDLHPA